MNNHASEDRTLFLRFLARVSGMRYDEASAMDARRRIALFFAGHPRSEASLSSGDEHPAQPAGMVSFVKSVTFDCAEPMRLAAFWAAALGSDVDEDSTPERAWVEPAGWGGPRPRRHRAATAREPGRDD